MVPPVPACAAVNQVLLRDGHQAERVIEFAIGQQSGIGGDARTAKLQLEATVEIEPRASDSASPAGCAIIASIQ